MKLFPALFLTLLAGRAVQGRWLFQNVDCANASAALIATSPDLTNIAGLIEQFGLLPPGIPEDATIFLPDNAAVEALLLNGVFQQLVPNATLETLYDDLQALKDPSDPTFSGLSVITPKLVSTILYHIVPGTASSTEQDLANEEDLNTALDFQGQPVPLTFLPNGTATTTNWVVQDQVPEYANVLSKAKDVCGSQVFLVDKILLPVNNGDLALIPDTQPEAVAGLLGLNTTSTA